MLLTAGALWAKSDAEVLERLLQDKDTEAVFFVTQYEGGKEYYAKLYERVDGQWQLAEHLKKIKPSELKNKIKKLGDKAVDDVAAKKKAKKSKKKEAKKNLEAKKDKKADKKTKTTKKDKSLDKKKKKDTVDASTQTKKKTTRKKSETSKLKAKKEAKKKLKASKRKEVETQTE